MLVLLSLAGSTLAIEGEPNGMSALLTPKETVLHVFAGGKDGSFPNAPLIADAQGALYGTTANGGDGLSQGAGYGTIFKLTPPADGETAWTHKVLYRFKGRSDGSFPYAGLIMDEQGALYGTTETDGSSGINGTVFKLTPPHKDEKEWSQTVLYAFHGSDGSAPVAGLIRDKQGALYGTTSSGGLGFGFGIAFKLTPPAHGETAWTETVLHLFTGGSDGNNPFAGLTVGPDGALYGTTSNGGSTNNGGYGTVFKLSPPARGETGWTETVLYNFSGGSDGSVPQAGVIFDHEGALYGTTTLGGNGSGTVFKLSPPAKGGTAWTETVLYSFSGGSDGNSPASGLIADTQGALYGTTAGGGGNGVGAVFKLTPPSRHGANWGESVLYSFKGGSDGSYPYASVIGSWRGNLYGTTSGTDGAPGDFGTVFELSLCSRAKHAEANALPCPAFPWP